MKLTQRMDTTLGPRTIVVQGLSREHAYAVMNATLAAGGECYVGEDGCRYDMASHLRLHAEKRRIATSKNVTPLRKTKP